MKYEDADSYSHVHLSPVKEDIILPLGFEHERFDLPSEGRKFDGGKLEYGLLPPHALEETVKVLTFGAQKYERGNWIKVPDSKRRYFDALQRHMWAWKKGEQIDPESGLHHLAHAMCCLMFLYEHDTIYSVDNDEVKNETI
jgi:hypothetical protein